MQDITAIDDSMHSVLRAAADAAPTVVDAAPGATIVLHHADVERLAFDHALAGVGLSFFDLLEVPEGSLRRWYGSLMFTNEGPVHHRLRALVSRAFTPRAVEAMRADAAAIATEALAPLGADRGGDLVAATSMVPMRVMCRLLGVPDDDVDEFAAWADALSPVFGFFDADQRTAASDAIEALLAYVGRLADRRRADPGADLITALLAAEDDGDRLDHATLVDMVANLLVGGHDTTGSQLACTLLTLVRHPGEASRLRADPSLLAVAVSESIRFEPSISGVPRTVVEPLDVAGATLAPGALLILSTAAANREPSIWRDHNTFDVERFRDPTTPRLLSFGAGVHYCLGAALARLTVEETVRAALDLGDLHPAADPYAVSWRSVLGRAPERVLVSVA
jgi:cytochrome P450